MPELLILGLNHTTADVSLREKASFTTAEMETALPAIMDMNSIDECAILSTCNRTEMIASVNSSDSAFDQLIDFMSEKTSFHRDELEKHVYRFDNSEGVRHLFKVAPGLESMVLGEPQIAGQVKDAFEKAIEMGTAGNYLMNLYRHTLQTVKVVRNDTDISKSAVSVSYVAVELARKVFGKLEGKRALLIGAGEMCELAATHLKERGVDSVDVVNRTLSKAEELAGRFDGNAYGFDRLMEAMEHTDIVLSSTGATEPVVRAEDVKAMMKRRKRKSLLMIDIAIPRDIEEQAGDISDVFLFDLDDLQKAVEANVKKRGLEAEKALSIVDKRVLEFEKWCRVQNINPVIVNLRQRAEDIRRIELEKSMKKLKDQPEEVIRELDRLSYSIMNKILHQPITELKKAAKEDDFEHKMMHFFKSIFNIE